MSGNSIGVGAFLIRRLSVVANAEVGQLADVLIDCVEGFDSVGFMLPMTRETALAFWERVADDVADASRALLVAEDDSGIVGTVQVVLRQPENQPHRADVAKMLVHRRARRRGIGAALMSEAEDLAARCGKTLLVLDTASTNAERLYARMGWQLSGVVPDFALLPQGGYCDTKIFFRRVGAPGAAPRATRASSPAGQ